ncbi:plasmid mobilization protein [Paraburkholderia sp. ZP32-5]|uniref:plasmid mobilization protein n=1 Tax=Paraburkholderia sp. ZP32-5 TaxID=2883245 RepID=UPI003FA3B6CD
MSEPGKAQKTVSVCLRMTAEDKAVIEEKARNRTLTVTEYLTRAGLAARPSAGQRRCD